MDFLNLDRPIQFFLINSEPLEKQWNPQLKVVYVLNGEIEITVNDQKFLLKENQLIVINPYTIHSISTGSFCIGIFLFNITILDPSIMKDSLQIDCNSITTNDENQLYQVKHILARIMKLNLSSGQFKYMDLSNKSLAYELIYELITKFSVKNHSEEYSRHNSQLKRMEEILKFINLHYAENISLNQLSEHFFITVPYLSRLFKKFIKMNFSDYLNNIRLSHAITYLGNPSITIDNISEICGFPNSRSFVAAFKKEYHMYPSAYRKGHPVYQTNIPDDSIQSNHYMNVIAKYIEEDIPQNSHDNFLKLHEISPVDVTQKGFPLKHNFKNMIGIGKAKHILYSDIQHILVEMQREIGFKYITFYGLLDDDMMLYSEDDTGNPKLNFQYIDQIIDFLLSIHLKPFIQLSFMPKALAGTPDRTMFYIPSVISLPNSMEKWSFLVKELTKHLLNRYSSQEVETWPFCLWNEPEDYVHTFGFKNKEEFFYFYKITFDCVKECNPDIEFGTPSLITDTLEQTDDWFKDFMEYCKKNKCNPDFLNYHYFPHILDKKTVDTRFLNQPKFKYRKSPDAFKESIYQIIKNIKKNKWEFSDIFLTQWNITVSHGEPINDTAFNAAYIVKNILENYDRIDSFSYWRFSDYNDELQMPDDMYFGGQGLITSNGVKKAGYYAFHMLCGLGNTLIGKGNGYFITKEGESYQIILYNYQHYSRLYSAGEFDAMPDDRYTSFENLFSEKYIIPLQNIPNQKYTIKETILNRNHGSSFDKWIEFGSQPLENQQEIEYLKNISMPLIKKKVVTVENNYLNIACELEPHEVRLVKITP
jgi:xylan 1,4-beta-xylosidase